MSESKHTPGPWLADSRSFSEPHGSRRFLRSPGRHWAMVTCHSTIGCSDPSLDISENEAEANARLIAAAPDLLEAAEAALAAFDGSDIRLAVEHTPAVGKLRDAIARAEGRS